MQALCQLSYSPRKLADYSEGTWIAAKRGRRGNPACGAPRSVDVEVDPEQDERPQEDRQQRRDDELQEAGADVVVGEGHVDADQDIDQHEQTVSAAKHGSTPLPDPPPERQRSLRRGVPTRQTNQSRMKRAGSRTAGPGRRPQAVTRLPTSSLRATTGASRHRRSRS